MAAKKIVVDSTPAPVRPQAPAERPPVQAAARLLQRVQAEHETAVAAHQAARDALTAAQQTTAEQMLAAVESEVELPMPDPALEAAIQAAARRVADLKAALDLARQRHAEALDLARQQFSTEIRPILAEAMAEAAAAALDAAALNDVVRDLATFAHDCGASGLPATWEIALKLPSRAMIESQVEARRGIFSPKPTGPAPGMVLVRYLVVELPNMPGDLIAAPAAQADAMIRAGIVELIDPSLAKELGIGELAKFTGPTKVRFNKDFTTRGGITHDKGTVAELPAATASRLVNLGYAAAV